MVTQEEKFNDAYNLILSSIRVSKEVKNLLKERLFLEENQGLVLELAKLLFLVDSISIENDEIVARKKVSRIKEPAIPIDDIIYRYLLKIKYDKLYDTDILKLNELQQYPSYTTLYTLLNLAIDQKVKIKQVLNDANFKMSIGALEVFLRDE